MEPNATGMAIGSGGGVELRLFAALGVASDPARHFADYADAVASRALRSEPVDPATMHVTFAYLGGVGEDYVPVVARALDLAAASVPGPTECAVTGVGGQAGGRVLALDIDLDLVAVLDSQRDRFLQTVTPYAPQLDRRAWRPHVSLLRAPVGATLPSALLEHPPAPPAASWVATGLQLFASLPGPTARQYRVLHSAPFGAPVHHG